MINLSIFLYGKPAWDMDIEGEEDIGPEMLKEQGDYLKEHLHTIASVIKKLKSAGWTCCGTLYTLELYNEEIKSKKEALKELKRLGIDQDLFSLEELDEEEI